MNKKGFLATYIIDMIAFLLFVVIAVIFFVLLKVSAANEIKATIQGQDQLVSTNIALLSVLRTPIPYPFIINLADEYARKALEEYLQKHPEVLRGETYADFLQNAETTITRPETRSAIVRHVTESLFAGRFSTPVQFSIKYQDDPLPAKVEFNKPVVIDVLEQDKIVSALVPMPGGKAATVTLFIGRPPL